MRIKNGQTKLVTKAIPLKTYCHISKTAWTSPPPNEVTRPANSTPLYSNDSFSAHGGPLRITYPNFSTSFATWIKLALKELGLSEVAGFVDGNILGYSYCPFALDSTTQTRESSETSFLREALSCETNLNVYQLTRAEKIVFDDQKKATGVVVNSGGSVYQLNATKEVILSSGAVRNLNDSINFH